MNTGPLAVATGSFSVEQARQDFPILHTKMRGKPLTYLDSAASSQKPNCVIEAINRYYREQNANIHRGVYQLSEQATIAYDGARRKIKTFLNAADERSIVFVRGTTEGLNLIASCVSRSRLKPGDEIIISHMEHHSNIVPWQLACEQTGAKLRVIPINHDGELLVDEYEKLLSPRTKVVSIAHQSNALGTVNPVKQLVARAKEVEAITVIDGAQGAVHRPVDVQDINCDFYTVSGHKLYGATGIGALYGRLDLLEELPPYQGGGDMIRTVSFKKTTYHEPPSKFEAGTPNIVGAIGLGAAVDYVMDLDREAVEKHEKDLLDYGTSALSNISGLRIIGTAKERAGLISFVLGSVHPHDLGTVLDGEGIAVRAGHHCAQPVMDFFEIPAAVRASFALYNTREEIDRLVKALQKALVLFGS